VSNELFTTKGTKNTESFLKNVLTTWSTWPTWWKSSLKKKPFVSFVPFVVRSPCD